MASKVMSAREAVSLIRDDDVLAISAAGVIGFPDYVVKALEDRFLETEHPRGLTLFSGCGHGTGGHQGDNRFAHKGFLKCAIGSHPEPSDELRVLIEQNELEAYVLPQGILNQLYRCSAAKQPGLLSKIGIGTYIDPRLEGGKINSVTKEEIVSLMELNGEEWLFYKSHPISAGIIRGTSADENGNLTIEHEPLKLEILEIALAVKARGGKVIAQVKQVVTNGTLCSQHVVVPAELIDAVVVTEEPELYHRQSKGIYYSPFISGELRCPPVQAAQSSDVLEAQDVVCRRAVYELYPGAVVNVGVGIGSGVGTVAEIENMVDKVTFTLELGLFGGTPQKRPNFATSVNQNSFVAHPSMFDFYHGGGLDITFLGAAEVDKDGNVNVSRFGGRAAGQGGFIDISQTSKKVVFCTYFKARGLAVQVADGKVAITEEGKTPKFVENVDQITFNGKLARELGKEVYYVTERAVFKLVKNGVMLVEIAPGIDLEKDIIGQMGFRPLISENLKIMDARIFVPGRMGCFDA